MKILSVILLFLMFATVANADYCNTNSVNIRNEARQGARSLGMLNKGDTVMVKSQDGEWCYIESRKGNGYIPHKYINHTGNEEGHASVSLIDSKEEQHSSEGLQDIKKKLQFASTPSPTPTRAPTPTPSPTPTPTVTLTPQEKLDKLGRENPNMRVTLSSGYATAVSKEVYALLKDLEDSVDVLISTPNQTDAYKNILQHVYEDIELAGEIATSDEYTTGEKEYYNDVISRIYMKIDGDYQEKPEPTIPSIPDSYKRGIRAIQLPI